MIELAGFTFSTGTQRAILVVFILYSVVVIGLGFYTKFRSRNSHFNDFMTGGGKIGPISTAMIALTAVMGGGVMMSAPGMAYRDGLIYSVCGFAYFINNFTAIGSYGKKHAIMKQRLHAETPVQLLHHRFQSNALTIFISLAATVFLIMVSGAQFVTCARVFGAIMGSNAYTIGLIISVVIVMVYTLAGGAKSLAKVCVVQGFVMLAGVILMIIAAYGTVTDMHGSMQAAFEASARVKEVLINSHGYQPAYFLGVLLIATWANPCYPAFHQTCMMYDKTSTFTKAIIMSTVCCLIINVIMSTSGPIAFTINPDITNADYATTYLATNLLPGPLAGLLIAGIFAAIQSSVTAFLFSIAGIMTRDVYKDCINRKADDKKLGRVNVIIFIVCTVIATISALNPTDIAQAMIILACGGIACSYGVPVLFGTYWKKATPAGAWASAIGGFVGYFFFYYLSVGEGTMDWYNSVFNGAQPLLPGLVIGIVLMIVVSLATQNKKVPLGIYRVWFCKDYDERYASVYNAKDLAALEQESHR